MAAKRTTPDEERKKAEADAAKVMASLRETHTLHDTNRQESPNEAVNKTHQSESSKKRPRPSIINRKRGKKKHGQHQDNEKICHAGLHCRMGDSDVVVEGNASNGCLCSKCLQNFILFVCIGFKKTIIARIVTRNMWCHSVKLGPSFRSSFKVKRRQRHNPAVHTLKVISSSMWIIT